MKQLIYSNSVLGNWITICKYQYVVCNICFKHLVWMWLGLFLPVSLILEDAEKHRSITNRITIKHLFTALSISTCHAISMQKDRDLYVSARDQQYTKSICFYVTRIQWANIRSLIFAASIPIASAKNLSEIKQTVTTVATRSLSSLNIKFLGQTSR